MTLDGAASDTAEIQALTDQFGAPMRRRIAVGSPAFWRAQTENRTQEVCMVIQRPSGRYLTFRKRFYLPGVFRLLTGGVEPGESVLDALQREVREETSLQVSVERFLAVIAYEAEAPDRQRLDSRPLFLSHAFLLSEHGGTLAPGDLDEQLEAYGETDMAGLDEITDRLSRLPDSYCPDLGQQWSDWGCVRAALHRVVAEALRQ